MGLDAFSTPDSGKSSSSNSGSGSSRGSSSSFYRCIWNGKETLADGYKELTIEGREKWNKIVDFIEENYEVTEEELDNLSHEVRYKLVRNAEMELYYEASANGEIKKTCFVCGNEFKFPKNWDFEEYRGKAVCPDHEVAEVRRAELDAKGGGT